MVETRLCKLRGTSYYSYNHRQPTKILGKVPKTGIPVHIEPKPGTHQNQVKNARHEQRVLPIRKLTTFLFLRLNSSSTINSKYAASKIFNG